MKLKDKIITGILAIIFLSIIVLLCIAVISVVLKINMDNIIIQCVVIFVISFWIYVIASVAVAIIERL